MQDSTRSGGAVEPAESREWVEALGQARDNGFRAGYSQALRDIAADDRNHGTFAALTLLGERLRDPGGAAANALAIDTRTPF